MWAFDAKTGARNELPKLQGKIHSPGRRQTDSHRFTTGEWGATAVGLPAAENACIPSKDKALVIQWCLTTSTDGSLGGGGR